ncbi:TRI25 ligase, partial [Atractosteus spatula]|nr:TRI25 ligase [Atractosteus spatula]
KMAEGGISVSQDQFICPVCLDLLKDPVTLPCGHSYCMGCIRNCWDQDDQTGIYSCPQCRQTFTPRPVLGRNIMLAEVVEKLKETGLSGPPPAPSPAGPGDVLCDVCTGRQVRAVKSCLVCLASYCQTHLQPHYNITPLKRHRLVNATGQLEEKICPDHQKLREVFCRTDQTCICLLCSDYQHRDHDTVSAESAWREKTRQLKDRKTESQWNLASREKELQELRQAVDSLRSSAHTAVQDTDRIFTELIRSIERTRSELTQLIRAQERAAVSQAEGLLERLEQEIAELRRRDAELSQLSHTEDHIHFLQNFQSVCVPPGAGDSPRVSFKKLSFEVTVKAVSGLKTQLERVCKEELVKISRTKSIPASSEHKAECIMDRAPGRHTDTHADQGPFSHKPINSHAFGLREETEHKRCTIFTPIAPQELTQGPSTRRRGVRLRSSQRHPLLESRQTKSLSPICSHIRLLMAPRGWVSFTHSQYSGPVLLIWQHKVAILAQGHSMDLSQDGENEMLFPCLFLGTEICCVQEPQPRTRAQFLRYACQLTLDPNTVHRDLSLSEGNRKVTLDFQNSSYPDHPERFDSEFQVLCKQSLSAPRSYWEVEGSCSVFKIGVMYKRKRNEKECELGNNDRSWCLYRYVDHYTVCHNGKEIDVGNNFSPRIGVYVDHRAGLLSFYSVSGDTVSPIYSLRTTFTESLYPAFWICLCCTNMHMALCHLP